VIFRGPSGLLTVIEASEDEPSYLGVVLCSPLELEEAKLKDFVPVGNLVIDTRPQLSLIRASSEFRECKIMLGGLRAI
jgi:hypothetical protein